MTVESEKSGLQARSRGGLGAQLQCKCKVLKSRSSGSGAEDGLSWSWKSEFPCLPLSVPFRPSVGWMTPPCTGEGRLYCVQTPLLTPSRNGLTDTCISKVLSALWASLSPSSWPVNSATPVVTEITHHRQCRAREGTQRVKMETPCLYSSARHFCLHPLASSVIPSCPSSCPGPWPLFRVVQPVTCRPLGKLPVGG